MKSIQSVNKGLEERQQYRALVSTSRPSTSCSLKWMVSTIWIKSWWWPPRTDLKFLTRHWFEKVVSTNRSNAIYRIGTVESRYCSCMLKTRSFVLKLTSSFLRTKPLVCQALISETYWMKQQLMQPEGIMNRSLRIIFKKHLRNSRLAS